MRLRPYLHKRMHPSQHQNHMEKHLDSADVPDRESAPRCPGETKFSHFHSRIWDAPLSFQFVPHFPSQFRNKTFRWDWRRQKSTGAVWMWGCHRESTKWAQNYVLCQKAGKYSRNEGPVSKDTEGKGAPTSQIWELGIKTNTDRNR